MSPRSAKETDFAEASRLIRREIRTERNAHFLRRLPVFKTDSDVPDEMRDLLARLDEAERSHTN